jgi:phosphopantothenoylcysteine decarboxylase/phosphopantothenate--cysteine ligase
MSRTEDAGQHSSAREPLHGRRIILGVSGGIAAYKSVLLLREYQQRGADVRCMMTPAAQRFIGKDTLSALSRQPVPVEVFPDDGDVKDNWTRHIQWAEWADIMVIAPCTAQTMAKIVHGFSDNMLTSTVLAARCPLLICPTMDGGMYESPATRANRRKAAGMGFFVMEPEHGYLASTLEDKGRLPDIASIAAETARIITERMQVTDAGPGDTPLKGKKVLVTAGPTREYLDSVRFISNPSSGKMGVAMARAAEALGASVELIHGPLQIPLPESTAEAGISSYAITSTQDMFDTIRQRQESAQAPDMIIMAAAVSDFRPASPQQGKVKKEQASLQVGLERTPDILHWLGEHRKPGQQLIGFAMETENLIPSAIEKRARKKADFIIANTIAGTPGSSSPGGFESDTNEVFVIGPGTRADAPPPSHSGSKQEVALAVLRRILAQTQD